MSSLPLAFDTSDLLNRLGFCRAFERFLITEHSFLENGLVVSLNAPFGSGKSWFLQMWADDLTKRRREFPQLPIPIILNAWETDYCGEPLLAMASEFSKKIAEVTADDADEKKKRFRKSATRLGLFFAGLANSTLANMGGPDIIESLNYANPASDPLQMFEGNVGALKEVRANLMDTFGGKEPKAIVLIDELDRCRPDYAVNFLETIKHVFNISGLIFVLAVDRKHLEASAKALFGEIDFPEYYRKFASRNVPLPRASNEDLLNLCRAFARRFVQTTEPSGPQRRSSLTDVEMAISCGSVVANGMQLSPRQVEEMFRIVGHAASITEDLAQALPEGFGYTAFFLAGLSLIDEKNYNAIANGKILEHELVSLVKTHLGAEALHWAAILYYGNFRITAATEPHAVHAFTVAGVTEQKTDRAIIDEIVDIGDPAWHGRYGGKGVRNVVATIESVKRFVSNP